MTYHSRTGEIESLVTTTEIECARCYRDGVAVQISAVVMDTDTMEVVYSRDEFYCPLCDGDAE